MSWDELTVLFLNSLARRGRSAATLKNGSLHLRRWVRFCQAKSWRPHQVEEGHLESYRQALLWGSEELALATQTAACQWVRQLLRWAFQQSLLWSDAGCDWKLAAVPPPVLQIPTAAQLAMLLAALPEDVAGLRDRAILETLYGSGLRLAECQALDLWDVHFQQGQLHVRAGKGGWPRRVPLGDSLQKALEKYLARSRPGYRPRACERALFLRRGGTRLLQEGYRGLVRRAGARIGLEERLHPHLLRHACALHLVEGGASLEMVAALLGHHHLRSTQRYTVLSFGALRQEHRRTHPRERRRP